MVQGRLREVLERGAGVGAFDTPDARLGRAEHPVCGDRVQLSVRVADGRVLGVRWQAAGCPATMALAALCAEALVDVPFDALDAALRAAIAAHGGLQRAEHHAEAMLLRALHAAVGA
ncbi:MAG: iron-sulfur cluster assembly scaffold protein [Planctomycetes bacterium]|nr:iron-sulfur cluster assembly scaffold protein [Planctomycetota bacterium]